MSFKVPLSLVMALGGAVPAAAAVLALPPVYTYQRSVHNQYNVEYREGPGTFALTNGAVSSGGSPIPFVEATTRDGWGYGAYYSYYFTIDGAGDEYIPIIGYFNLSVRAVGPHASASARINFNGDNRSLDTTSIVDQSVSGVIATHFYYLNLGHIELQVYTDVPYGVGSAYAFADPFLIIDPAYAAVDPDYATRLTLRFSEGVVNAAAPGAVPEPATWAMLVAGLGSIGGLMRRRRTVSFSS